MKPVHRKTQSIITMIVALAVIIAASGWILLHKGGNGSRGGAAAVQKNPFEYDLASVTAVDSALIGYRQTGTVPFDVEYPSGMCIDGHDRLYVAGNGGVFLLDTAGMTIRTLYSAKRVVFCAVDVYGRVYAGTAQGVQRYTPEGAPEKVWSTGNDSTILVSIALDDNAMYIGDAGVRTVWRLDTSWRVLNRIGGRDTARGVAGFILPSPHMALAAGPGGSLWAVNPGRHSIENYRPNGDPVSSWGAAGSSVESFCGCCNPIRLAILPNGGFVTSEKGIVRVKVYDPAGTFVCVVAPPSAFTTAGEGLDIAVDSRERILVMVAQEKMIRIYEKK